MPATCNRGRFNIEIVGLHLSMRSVPLSDMARGPMSVIEVQNGSDDARLPA
jgi:hypothetical protein